MATAYDKVEVLGQRENSTWHVRRCELAEVLGSHVPPPASSIVFVKAGELKNDQDEETKQIHRRLQDGLRMPREFWTKMSLDASGFFRAKEHVDDDGQLALHESWLRLQTKQAMREKPKAEERLGEITYHWQRLGFFIRWWPDQKFTAYCFDLPDELRSAVKASVESLSISAYFPSAVWSFILESALPSFDAQVWKCRDLIRWHEKNRPLPEDGSAVERPKPEYEDLHEIARHAIHSTEMLQTALHVLAAIEEEHAMCSVLVSQRVYHREITRSLSYCKTMLQGFEGRSRALETRLANEMQLTFHLNSQFDSMATGAIAQSSSEDSAAMRTISFLGLIFLPGTFISAIFSMSFFNFEPPNNATTQEWRMSSKFWIFWVFCIPITAVTILLWTWWHNRTRQRLRNTSTFYIPEAKSDGKEQARLSLKLLTSRRALAQPKDVEKGMLDQAKRPEWTSYASSRSSQSPS